MDRFTLSRRSLVVGVAAGAVSLSLADRIAAAERYTIATGGTGGVYYPYGGAMASMLGDAIPDTEWTAEETSASVDNMYLIEDGSATLAFSLADTAYDASQGNDPFEDKINAQSLVTLYNNYTQIVAKTDAGISSIEDLKGKNVSVGSPNSGTEVIALRILEAAGIDADNDISREQLGAADSANAMKDNKIDAFFWSGGLPTSAITDLAATPNMQITLLPSTDYLQPLRDSYGNFYMTGTIPAGTYPNQNDDVEVIAVPNLLVVNGDMDEQLAYDVTKALFDNHEILGAAHPEAKHLTLETALSSEALPYHPGALKYLEEQGVTPGMASPEATPAG